MRQTSEEKKTYMRNYMKSYYQRPEVKARLKANYEQNKDKINAKQRAYMQSYKQRPEQKAYRKTYREKNKEKIKARLKAIRQTQEWKDNRNARYNARQQIPEQKIKQIAKRRVYNQKPEVKARHTAYGHNYILTRTQTDSIFCLVRKLRILLRNSLTIYSKNGKIKHASEYGINYNKICEYLKPTLEKQKDNHIDHVIPISHFDLNNEIEIRLCFSAENLEWLSGPENLSKGANIRQEDLLELKRRQKEDGNLDINILNQLIERGEEH